eukprot:COSAG05_NODE_19620_length_290_cov_0.685864_1_plen_21_part_10
MQQGLLELSRRATVSDSASVR